MHTGAPQQQQGRRVRCPRPGSDVVDIVVRPYATVILMLDVEYPQLTVALLLSCAKVCRVPGKAQYVGKYRQHKKQEATW